jgi:exodeoxyribonuclease-3
MRIDHFLLSSPAFEACIDVVVDTAARGGKGASDHAPVIATFADDAG